MGYEGLYEVSSLGKVRSLPRVITTAREHTRKLPGKLLTPGVTQAGYHLVVISQGVGRGKSQNVHRIVATAFLENPNQLPLVRHLNDVGTDNRVENLAWGTYSENRRDAVASGAYVNQHSKITHCKRGHPLSGDNLYIPPSRRGRYCRRCRKLHDQISKNRRRNNNE